MAFDEDVLREQRADASVPAFGSALVAAAIGFCVEGITLATSELRAVVASFAILIGLWALMAGLAALVARGLARMAFGPLGLEQLVSRLRSTARKWWSERSTEADRRRLFSLLVGGIGVIVYASASWLAIALLLQRHRDPLWIAAGALAAQLLIALLLLLPPLLAVRRLCLRFVRRLPSAVSTPTLFAVGVTLALAAAIWLVATHWSWISLAGLRWALLVGWLIVVFLGLLFARPRRLLIGRGARRSIILAALALSLAGLSVGRARVDIALGGAVTPFVQAAIIEASDFDGDRAASVPFGADCRPFDAAVHPLASEIVGNGIDENCDGLDQAPPLPMQARLAPGKVAFDQRPDIVLITLDAARADHFGFMGYERATSPDLDRLAAKALIFERAYAQDSGTGPSLWSLMSGKTPFQAELRDAQLFPPNLGPKETTLAELLAVAGYRSATALCGSMFAAPHWNIRRGFDSFREVCGGRSVRLAEHVRLQAERALAGLESGRDPFFFWVHFFDPHHPYHDHPDLDFGERPIDLYDEEIRYLQGPLSAFIERALGRSGRARPLRVFLTADHGENFGEHGTAAHARTLYREVTHVPFLVWGDGIGPRRIRAPVAVGDLYPTIAEISGGGTRSELLMHSLANVLRGGEAETERLVFQENSWSRPRRHVKGVIAGRYHLIRDLSRDTVELYDMVADPREAHDLAGSGLQREVELRRWLDAFVTLTTIPPELL